MERDRHDRTEPGPARQPEEEGIGEGIADERLEPRSRERERAAHEERQQRPWQPQCPDDVGRREAGERHVRGDRKSTRLNSSHLVISYAVFCLKKKKK